MERLDEDLKMLRDMRERLNAMLLRIKTAPDVRDSEELGHVTGELIRSLDAEIKVLEKATAGIERRNVA